MCKSFCVYIVAQLWFWLAMDIVFKKQVVMKIEDHIVSLKIVFDNVLKCVIPLDQYIFT